MATLHDRHPTHRALEASVDVAVGPDDAAFDLRRQVIALTLDAILAALGPIPVDGKVAAAVDVTLSLWLSNVDEPAKAIFPVGIVFNAREDHGDGTAGWSPDELLAAVVRNEVERSWRRFRMESFVSNVLALTRCLQDLRQRRGGTDIAHQVEVEDAELAMQRLGLSPGRILAQCWLLPTSPWPSAERGWHS